MVFFCVYFLRAFLWNTYFVPDQHLFVCISLCVYYWNFNFAPPNNVFVCVFVFVFVYNASLAPDQHVLCVCLCVSFSGIPILRLPRMILVVRFCTPNQHVFGCVFVCVLLWNTNLAPGQRVFRVCFVCKSGIYFM